MKSVYKITIISIATLLVGSIIYGIGKATITNYFNYNPINFIAMLIGAFALSAIIISWANKIYKEVGIIILSAIILQSCNYAKSNQQVVVSDDCGVTWKKINAGESVPKAGMNPCYMKVVIPNYPMQGESKFVSNLKGRVRVSVHVDYDYSITNPLAFIKQAKSLGKANTDADSEQAIDSNFEGAENMVIDKRIKDVAKDIFIQEDILELDQSELEDKLLQLSNKVLLEFGVSLNFITLTFDLDEQTRQAIDVSTAMKIYTSKSLDDVGKLIMVSKAGATKISIENKPEVTSAQ